MWADHERRWPERQPAAEPDRPADPPGTYRSRGGFKLNPERHAETVGAIGRLRETEPSISADMQVVEKEYACGGWLAGFDRRIKGDDRLKEKVAEQAAAEPDKPSSAILRKIPDALRFTCCFEPDSYVRGYYDIKARLEDAGHEMYQSTNYWADPEYKGINTRWITQPGQRFEVQFPHPRASTPSRYVTHSAYERIRNPTIIGTVSAGELRGLSSGKSRQRFQSPMAPRASPITRRKGPRCRTRSPSTPSSAAATNDGQPAWAGPAAGPGQTGASPMRHCGDDFSWRGLLL